MAFPFRIKKQIIGKLTLLLLVWLSDAKAAQPFLLEEIDHLVSEFQTTYTRSDTVRVRARAGEIAREHRFAPFGTVLERYLLAEYSATRHVRIMADESPESMILDNIRLLEAAAKRATLPDFGKALLALNLHTWGMQAYRSGELSAKEALPLLLQANQICQELGYGRCPQTAMLLSGLGEFYYLSKEYSLAIKYLEEANHYMEQVQWDWLRINHANTLGLYYLSTNQDEKALQSYAEIIPLVKSAKDSIWIGIANGNMAEIHYGMGQTEQAREALAVDVDYSKRYRDTCSVAEAYVLWLKVTIMEGAQAEALAILDSMRHWTEICGHSATERNSLLAESLYYEWRGDYPMAHKQYKRSRIIRDSLSAERVNQKIQANTIRFEAERYQIELEMERQRRAYLQLQRNVALGFILGLSLLAFVFYKYRKAQRERKRIEGELEKQRLEQSLREARMELKGFSDALRKKNQIIEDISQELDQSKDIVDKEGIIEQLCQSTILTTEDWLRFSHLFEQVHPDFLPTIRAEYPSLTQNDLRILVLSQLAFSTRDMASTLGVSMDAIHKAKYRLRKKLSLPSEVDLVDIAQYLRSG